LLSVSEKVLKCVVLNACYSDEQVEEILNYSDHVIAMSGEVNDADSLEFSKIFYRAISNNYSVKKAFALAIQHIDITVGGDSDKFILFPE
jgi:hypothetical protein